MALLQVILFACILFLGIKDHTPVGKGNDYGDIWPLKRSTSNNFTFSSTQKTLSRRERIRSFLVGFVTECALRCLRHDLCISFNIEDTTANQREVICELLPKGVYQISHKLHPSERFHHWSITVSEPCFG